MKPLRLVLLSLVTVSTLLAGEAPGWETLFDGTSTAKWRGFKRADFPAKGWVIENGALKVQAGVGGDDLVTRDEYGSFELLWEWKVSEGANSGLLYHASEEFGASYETGLEYQILDDAKHGNGKNPKTSAGALYALIAPGKEKHLQPVGEWNKSRLVVSAPFRYSMESAGLKCMGPG
jgi:hypothetical protein